MLYEVITVAPDVHGVATPDAGYEGRGRPLLARRVLGSLIQVSQGAAPPEHVAAAIAAGNSAMSSDGEVHLPPRREQFLRNLAP